MADDNEVIIEQPSEAEKRIKQLSGKVREEAEAKDAALQAKAEAETKLSAAEKKAAFAEGYADMVATNPAAKEFKADIEAKVMSGYSVEDATFAVLGKAGKLGTPAQAPQSPAGGSAANQISKDGPKPVGEMTQAERRAALDKELIWQ